jgi:hypothetical protein
MFERFLCDFIYPDEQRVEINELICGDRAEALEWFDETFMELHFEGSHRPKKVCLRQEDEVIAEWKTHFDAVN